LPVCETAGNLVPPYGKKRGKNKLVIEVSF